MRQRRGAVSVPIERARPGVPHLCVRLTASRYMKTPFGKILSKTIIVAGIFVLFGCGDRRPSARPWSDVYLEFRSRGDVVFNSEPRGSCTVGTPFCSRPNAGVDVTYKPPGGTASVRLKFDARAGKIVFAYPVTMADGTMVAVAVYEPMTR